MRESRAYNRLRKMFPEAHWTRVETWTEPGVFDVNVCHKGVELWIECKQVAMPFKADSLIKPEVKKEQVVWELRRRRAGGRTRIALMVGNVLYVLPGPMLKDLKEGVTFSFVLEMALECKELFDV